MAKKWSKIKIQRENGEMVDAQAPVIVSASRSTDIPAFYADWFFKRLEIGYSAWTNPFNNKLSYVSYEKTRFIVFWSKNPEPLLPYLDTLKEKGINCYIQYSLNDYQEEHLEKVPSLERRIQTFKKLVDKLGKGHVIWRFDPLILTNTIGIDHLLRKIENIGDQLLGYTEKLVFSYADIASYRKVKSNLDKNHILYQEWTEDMMTQFAERIAILNQKWNYQLATCGEKIDIQQYGIQHNHCIDEDLMIRFAYKDQTLMNFLGVEIGQKGVAKSLFDDGESIPENATMIDETHYAIKSLNNKDLGQRQFCGCIISKDIGQYNTCPHQCEYCYANTSKNSATSNYKQHKLNPYSETITGK